MPSTNGHGPKRAVLYARVSTEEQARHGYSLRQQMEALREYAAREGYEVLEEATDPGQSGASLERPGLDKVRDLVAAGGVSAVLATERDRFSREPAHMWLLREELAEHGTKLRALNSLGDSAEAELGDAMMDQVGRYFRRKMAEKTAENKVKKAREGKIVAAQRCPNYGFVFNKSRDAYLVDPETMSVVRRIFETVGVKGRGINYLVGALEREGVRAPRGGRWNKTMVRNILVSDLYKPMSAEEVAPLVAPEVAARLDTRKSYGIWWYNRRKTKLRRVVEDGPEGRLYKRKNDARLREPEEWVAVPVDITEAELSCEVVHAARAVVVDRRRPSSAGHRFWELSGGVIRCGVCGNALQTTAVRRGNKTHYYYRCRQRYNNGLRDCTNSKVFRAEKVEAEAWEELSGLLKDPERLRVGIECMIEEQRAALRRDPDKELRHWHTELEKAERMRDGYLEQQAEGIISMAELKAKLAALGERRKVAENELDKLAHHQERIAELERDAEALMERYRFEAREGLDLFTPEDRHDAYEALRIKVIARSDGMAELAGSALEADSIVCTTETTRSSS
jgi:site-specific DNA recombinase